MRRHRLLRGSPPSLCIFCISRFLTHDFQPTVSQIPRRRLNTTQSPRQSSGAAVVAAQETDNNAGPNSSTTGFDPNSSLSRAEQAEKEHRRQQRMRAEAEQQRRHIEDMEQRDSSAKAAGRARDQEQQRGQVEGLERRGREGRVGDAGVGSDSRPGLRIRRQSVFSPMEKEEGREEGRRTKEVSRTRQAQGGARDSRPRVGISEDPGSRERRQRDQDNPFARANGAAQQSQPPRRTAMPDFGGRGQNAQQKDVAMAGWGSGGEATKPLEYFQRGDAAAAEVRPLEQRSFDESANVGASPPASEARGLDESLDARSSREGAREYIRKGYDPNRKRQPQPPREPDYLNTFGGSNEEATFDAQKPTPDRTSGFYESASSSYDPPPQRPRVSQNSPPRYDSFAESQYRATPFNSNEYQPPPPRQDEGQAASWQILRRARSSEPAQRQQQQQPQPPAQNSRTPRHLDDADVDRQFQQHRTQRDARLRNRYGPPPTGTVQSYSNPNITDATSPPEFNAFPARTPRRCARCLEQGHMAKECTGPVRATCHSCGQVGHLAGQCPNRQGGKQREERSTVRSVQSTNPFGLDEGGTQRNERSGVRSVRSTVAVDEPFGIESSAFGPEARSPRQVMGGNEQQIEEGPQRFARDSQIDREVEEVNEATLAERRARRSKRGFADAPEEAGQALSDRRQRRQGRRNLERDNEDAVDEAEAEREERAARKAARRAERKAEKEALKRERGMQVELPEFISVSQLSQTLGVRYEALIKRLEELGYDDVFAGKILNKEISGMIAMEYDFEPVFESSAQISEEEEKDLHGRPAVEDTSLLPTRPPVVTIMGHVDHGKTTILDYLRKSSIAAGEAGGITQHIGAFSVPLTSSGKTITFLDTPGHAAFLAMRQRGANVTDIVILVVAADDSVKPQTLESLRCAREAGVPIIVAINKVDKEEGDVQRVKQDLAQSGVQLEDFGGETQVVLVSGKTGQGMGELEEAVVTLSEILDQKAEMEGRVEGWVLEATTKKAGRVATVLVKRGTLRPGAVVVAGKTWARVRTLRNEGGVVVGEVRPGMPVEVDGWRDQPVAGDEVLQAPSEQKAGAVVEFRIEKDERERTALDMEAINEARRLEQEKRAIKKKGVEDAENNNAADSTVAKPQDPDEPPPHQTLPFLIKADVSGSAEAVAAYIPSLTSPLITPSILRASVGQINESDIELASAANAHIIAFNLPSNADMMAQAEARGVKVLENKIIYRVLDDVKGVLEARLPPVVSQRVLGEAEVGQSFEIGVGGRKKVWIAGCKVRNGVVGRGNRVRVLRGGGRVYNGTINSLKNVKKDVQEMRKGSECGMGFDGWEGFEVGDLVQTYEEISEKRRL